MRLACVDDIDVATILREFDGLWRSMSTDERIRILGLLIERIDHDGTDSSVTISFREAGLLVSR